MTSADDTIAAVSSPAGRSARALLRLSGLDANAIVGRLVSGGDRSDTAPNRGLVRSRLRVGETGGELPVLLARFAGPGSYTGQDMVEIQCPGHPALLDRLLRRMVAAGARLAGPGEFTYRAFLAGKMDLTQAEAVSAVIAARSDGQLRAAEQLRRGRLGEFAEMLVQQLGDQLALVEAGIDFVDQEDVVPIAATELAANLDAVADQLNDLLANCRSWSALEALPRVVLAGGPSVGKSTLFNVLLGRRRAATGPIPGTTRDLLAEPWMIGVEPGRPVELMLIDVAGLDAPESILDRAAQAAARRAFEEADLILVLDDGRGRVSPGPFERGLRCPVVRVRSKADLTDRGMTDGEVDVVISAESGEGLDDLRTIILRRLGERAVSVSAEKLALQPRHEAALRGALDHVHEAQRLLREQVSDDAIERTEVIAVSLRSALDELVSLGGALTPDDVMGRIFSKFCIGK